MFRALDDAALDQAVGQMRVAVGADAVDREEGACLVAADGIGLPAMVQADNLLAFHLGLVTDIRSSLRRQAGAFAL